MNLRQFLETVVTTPEGWFCLALGNNGIVWREEWYEWPKRRDEIVERALELAPETNVYFSPHLFKARARTKDNVLDTRTIAADLDEAKVTDLPVSSNVLLRTSPGRHQAFWLLESVSDLETLEILSRKLTYATPQADHSGWPLGHMFRLPETLNHKYLDGAKPIQIISTSVDLHEQSTLELLPDAPPVGVVENDTDFVDHPPDDEDFPLGPNQLLATYKDALPTKVITQYNELQADRSAALWALMCALFRAGASREEVYYIAVHSANNKFVGLRYHGDRELAKDVLRAQGIVSSGKDNPRAIIQQIRARKLQSHEKFAQILTVVKQALLAEGEFFHTEDDLGWYVRRDVGRPILLTRHGDMLGVLLDVEFGLNPVEHITSYCAVGLMNHAISQPVNGVRAAMSYYDSKENRLLLHCGRKDVLAITPKSVEVVTDGAYGVIFPWASDVEPFAPRTQTTLDEPWWRALFGNDLSNLINMPPEEGYALLRVWLLFLFLKNAAVSRPLLTLLGAPGSGKSTTFRRAYTFLYGRNKALGAVTTESHFDHASAVQPLMVLDNVDTWAPWLPDRLALAASNSDVTVRKLWTDMDTITLRRQAMIGISAHNPRFGREDVSDRMLIMVFRRLEKFGVETEIIGRIIQQRNALWQAVVGDLQRVLATPRPDPATVPQLRVEDFAYLGQWIADGLGFSEAFGNLIGRLRAGQRQFSLEEESGLVERISLMVERDVKRGLIEDKAPWRAPGSLWTTLLAMNEEDAAGFQKQYKSAQALSKKLLVMQEPLRAMFDIECKMDVRASATRVWRITRINSNHQEKA